MTHWFRIEQKHACFAVIVRADRVVAAAPIAKWAVGRPWAALRRYFEARGAKIQELKEEA